VDRDQLASLKDTSYDVNAAMISLILRRLEDPTAPLPYTGQRALAHDSGSRTAGMNRCKFTLFIVACDFWGCFPADCL